MKEKFSNKSLALMEVRTLKKRTSKVNYDFYEKKIERESILHKKDQENRNYSYLQHNETNGKLKHSFLR